MPKPSQWARERARAILDDKTTPYLDEGIALALDEARAEANLLQGNHMSYEYGFRVCRKRAAEVCRARPPHGDYLEEILGKELARAIEKLEPEE
jgi:hypothetical protein